VFFFLIPGGSATQNLQAMPAWPPTASTSLPRLQVSCPAGAAAVWKLLPASRKVLPFQLFESGVSLAELGQPCSVRAGA